VIAYLDSSALVKRYVEEPGSREVAGLIDQAALAGTAVITRVEVAAALAKAIRARSLSREEAGAALQAIEEDWESLVRLQLTELLISRAASLAWQHGLRGYDATHLSAALFWSEMLGEPVALATYDRQLWKAARDHELETFPPKQP
jgi:predicted nucleic acid-binding protein